MILITPRPRPHPLSQYRIILFDADGTLRRCTVPGQPCPHTDAEWTLMPHVEAILRTYPWSFTGVAGAVAPGICTNQGGVGLGYLPKDVCDALLYDLWIQCFYPDFPGTPHNIRVCYDAPDRGCLCRKPAPLLLYAGINYVLRHWRHSNATVADIRHAEVLYVGDQVSDCQAAQRVGIDFCYAHVFFGWPQEARA